MNNKIQGAFEPIRATDELKSSLTAFIKDEASKQHISRHKAPAPLRYAAICCAMLALVICGFGGYSLYQTPVSYISVDINPSVELGLNRLDRVVSAESYNDDGSVLLQNLNIKNKTYTEALELLLADKTFKSYLSDDSLLSFTVVSDKEEALLEGIRHCKGYSQTNAECHGANAALMDKAHHSGLSFGKYQAFLELSKYNKNITAEDCQQLSMREIRNLISQYTTGSNKNDNDNNGHGNGNGNGHRKNEKAHHGGHN